MKTTWLVDRANTRYRLVAKVIRVEFENRVNVLLHDGEQLTVKAEELRTWVL